MSNEKCVMIVEDDAILAYNLQRTLVELGYSVPPPVSSGEEALSLAVELIPDLILMDVRLKGAMDGFTAGEQIQAQVDIPVVFLSAYSDATITQRLQKVRAYGFLVKPASERDLFAALETAYARHLTDKRVLESEERYRILFDHMQDGVVVTSLGKIIQANRQMAKIMGFDHPDELIHHSVFDYMSSESRTKAEKHMQQLREDQAKLGLIRYTFVRQDGTPFEAELTATTFRFEDKLFGLAVVRDITQRLLLEKQIREARQDWETTFDAVKDLIFLVGTDGNINRCNKPAMDTLGLPPEEVNGKSLEHLLGIEKITSLRETPLQGEIRLANLPGWYEAATFPHDHEGVSLGSITIIRDITERKKMMDRFVEHSKTVSLSTLTAGMAHEMNTPLQILTGSADLLLGRVRQGIDVQDRLEQNLERISESAWRLAEIVHSLLTYTRSATEQLELCNLNRLVEETLHYLQSRIVETPDIFVHTELDESLPATLCDPNQITQLVIHLVSNALEAMPAGGKLTLRTRSEEDRVVLEVEDTGSGIPETIRDKIFDPFFSTRQFGDGMGLGLSVVLGIVKAHGGEISFESQEKRGTIFCIRIPAKAQANGDSFLDAAGRLGIPTE